MHAQCASESKEDHQKLHQIHREKPPGPWPAIFSCSDLTHFIRNTDQHVKGVFQLRPEFY